MGYGGKTTNGLSSLGPKMGGKAHGGGVKIEKNNISQSQDNILSGKFTSMGSAKIVSKGMAQYLAGESVGMKKYGHSGAAKMATVGKTSDSSDGDEKLTNRQAKTRRKARQAKDNADKANDGSSNASLDKMNKTKAKAERLAKRQKRQEGRAERKEIRKKGLSRGEKRKQIIESREKQKSKPKGEGMAKVGDRKKVKSVNEIGDRTRKDTYSYQKPKAKVLKK